MLLCAQILTAWYIGDLVVDLLWEECPTACTNFLKLCKAKYYNYTAIQTVRQNQLCYLGSRGEDYGGSSSIWGLANPKRRYFTPEVQGSGSAISFKQRGTVAFTTTPAQDKHKEFKHEDLLSDSEFCISLKDQLNEYDTEMAIFGNIVEGLDTLDKMNCALTDVSGKPLKPILILHSHILDDPFEDVVGIEFPEESPPPSPRKLDLIAQVYEDRGEDQDVKESHEKRVQDQEARAQALTLEIIGDLPFAEVRPEENVLFVCKLNPVTQSEDLELIFSRFGKIISCEVIKDQDTGESLQYAFIEFDKQEDCERAYFKMEGVLIDDRRIHVDFSQSVSKLSGSWRNKSNAKRQAAHGKKFQREFTRERRVNRSASPSTRRNYEGRNNNHEKSRDRRNEELWDSRRNRDERRENTRRRETRDRRNHGECRSYRDRERENKRDDRYKDDWRRSDRKEEKRRDNRDRSRERDPRRSHRSHY